MTTLTGASVGVPTIDGWDFSGLTDGTVGTHNSTTVVVDNGVSGETFTFHGTGFGDFDLNDVPQSGTITSFTYETDHVLVVTLAGFSMPVTDFLTYMFANDAVGLEMALFSGNDTLTGSNQADVLLGLGGNDSLSGRGGNDKLKGGDGNDTLNGGTGNDTLNGGSGSDTASYAGATGGVTVSLALSGAQAVGGGQGSDTLISIENLLGSSFGDHLTGNSGANILNGGSGNDVLNGGAGNDTLNGGSGSDTASYAGATGGVSVNLALAGAQAVGGGQGSDKLISIENLLGSSFGDHLTGNTGANTLNGGSGNDVLSGGGGADTLVGGAGKDTLTGGAGNDKFVFMALSDSTHAAPDLITDFTTGDKIDLHAIDAKTGVAGDQAFHVGGGGGHAGDITVTFDGAHNRTVVNLFVDNNSSIDATIWLAGDHHALAAGDFVL